MSQTALLMTLLMGWSPERLVSPPLQLAQVSDEQALAALTKDAQAMMTEAGLVGVVTARVKSPDSLQAKAARKGLAVEQVLDRIGLRLRVDTAADCYVALDHIHQRYVPISGSQDDYIAYPKPNGYRSLHTAVQTPLGIAEFQIRTHAMHAYAEHGPAAHAVYKALQAV